MEGKCNILFNVLKALVYIACTSLFLISLVDLWGKYQKNITNTHVEYIEDQNLTLPALTICPEEPFKVYA